MSPVDTATGEQIPLHRLFIGRPNRRADHQDCALCGAMWQQPHRPAPGDVPDRATGTLAS